MAKADSLGETSLGQDFEMVLLHVKVLVLVM